MESSEDYLQKKIIVIGAGVSGLASASCLRDYGFQNVLILEAKDRIGGRIHTVNQILQQSSEEREHFIELGAEWIHGEDGNVIYELAHSKGLINESAPNYYEALTNFNTLFTKEEAEAVNSLIEYLDEKTESVPEDMNETISLSDFLDKAFTEYLEQHKDLSMVEFLEGCYSWYNKIHCELNGCTSLSLVSTCLLNRYKECDGLQTVQLKFGFHSVLNLMYEKLPHGTILLNHVVETINWTDFKAGESDADNENSESAPNCRKDTGLKIKVVCKNREVYEADHVIITIPLGSLKKQLDTLFVPALSENKIRAINSIGFGTVNKIFLEFKDPFWEPPAIYHVIWKKSFDEIFEGSSENTKQWVKFINRFAYTPGHHHMLCVWVVGEGAVAMENLSSEEVSANCMELLEKIIGTKLPKPKQIIRSKWHSDPETHGSYSYLSTECNKESNLQVAKPELSDVFCSQHPVLQFAGEATNSSHFSTVHGAYESGIREAQRIFEHYRYS